MSLLWELCVEYFVENVYANVLFFLHDFHDLQLDYLLNFSFSHKMVPTQLCKSLTHHENSIVKSS